MAVKRSSKRRQRGRALHIHKPKGVLTRRVQTVGPEQFGIVSVDCAKARSKWMLCDFYGRQLVEPTSVTHSRADFDAALTRVRQAKTKARLKDLVVAVERTGAYHLPVKRAFRSGGFEVRIVHPFATKQFRQPADPGNKTDDTDLAAIHRAAVNGLGLVENELGHADRELQLLVRHRRDLVRKRSMIYSQMHEHLHATMPGYAALFKDIWESPVGLAVARHTGLPHMVERAGERGLKQILEQRHVPFHHRSIEKVLAWSSAASQVDGDAEIRHRIWIGLDDDRIAKCRQIQGVERDICSLLVRTPYVLLLSMVGINVVSAADFGGEMGPIEHYANAKHITGRAGLFPSRYQSDTVDHSDGPLVRCANRRLRTAIMTIADNLICCSNYFRARADLWKTMRKDPRHTRVKIAFRFSRISYQMVAGRQVFNHPCCRERSYILDKLMTFHREHQTPSDRILADLQAAMQHLPRREYQAEAEPLVALLDRTRRARTSEAQAIGDILPVVLAKLGLSQLQSKASGR